MSRPNLAVSSRQGKVRIEILETQHAESPSYRQHAAVTFQQVPQRVEINAVDLDIEVLRRLAAQQVPDVAAHDENAAASQRDLPGDVSDAGVDHGMHHTRVAKNGQWATRPTASETGSYGRT